MHLRNLASTYVYRRVRRRDCLNVDVFAYPVLNPKYSYAIRYQLRRGTASEPFRELVFMVGNGADAKQVPTNHPLLASMYLDEPVKLTARERSADYPWFVEAHHSSLRELATEYPLGDEFVSRSVRFHYFGVPDHDPRQGFANWYQRRRV